MKFIKQKRKIFFKKITSNRNAGFTLVEALFATLTLTFTITILMTVVSTSLFSSRHSKSEMMASYLMQEISDYIKNDRDTYVFKDGGSWDDFYERYTLCSSLNGGCYFGIEGNNVSEIKSCNNNCPFLYYDEEALYGSFYNYKETDPFSSFNEITSFRRKIIIEKDPLTPNEIKVNVFVNWRNGSNELERSLKTVITNWR